MEPPRKHRIDVVNETKHRVRVSAIREALAMTFSLHSHPGAEVCVLLTDDERMTALNKQFRQVDDTTDVLSFPAGDFPNSPLGDIAISVPCAKRQAQARGVPLDVELTYLAIHGGLHLMGFDDEKDEDRATMVAEMHRIGIAIGLPEDSDWSSYLHGDEA
jgi:probable rRNA maturation factor